VRAYRQKPEHVPVRLLPMCAERRPGFVWPFSKYVTGTARLGSRSSENATAVIVVFFATWIGCE
jgi:hypothetical protein